MAEKYEFLTDEWFTAARKIRDEYASSASGSAPQVRMNLIITGAPFNDGANILTHVDTSGPEVKMDTGHIEGPDVTITVDYETTKQVFVEGRGEVAMQAFMAGKLRVEGDMTKLMTMSAAPPDEQATEISERIKEITA